MPPMAPVLIAGPDDLAEAAASLLEQAGWTWTTVDSGAACLDALNQQRPSALVLDVGLTGPTVVELIARVRKNERLGDLPILLVTSVYRPSAYRREPQSLYGADGFVEHPHLRDQLLDRLQSLTGSPDSPDQDGGRGED